MDYDGYNFICLVLPGSTQKEIVLKSTRMRVEYG